MFENFEFTAANAAITHESFQAFCKPVEIQVAHGFWTARLSPDQAIILDWHERFHFSDKPVFLWVQVPSLRHAWYLKAKIDEIWNYGDKTDLNLCEVSGHMRRLTDEHVGLDKYIVSREAGVAFDSDWWLELKFQHD